MVPIQSEPESANVILMKEGFVDLHCRLAKIAKTGPIVCGLFSQTPFLWCYSPQPYQIFYLVAKGK